MNLFIVDVSVVDSAACEAAAKAHDEYLKKLLADGKLLTAGPKTGGDGEVIILTADSKEEAEQIVKADPISSAVVYLMTTHVVSEHCTTPEFKAVLGIAE